MTYPRTVSLRGKSIEITEAKRAARVAEIRAEIAGKGLLGRILARRRHAAVLRMMTRLIESADERIDAIEFGVEVQRAQVARQERAVREAVR